MSEISQYVIDYQESADKLLTLMNSASDSIEQGLPIDKQLEDDMSKNMLALRIAYEAVQRAARKIATDQFAPGAPIFEYETLIKQLEAFSDIKKVLEEFISIEAISEPYHKALLPYQKQAAEKLTDKAFLAEQPAIAAESVQGFALFLQCLKIDDLESPEGQNLLESLEVFFPVIKIHRGLSLGAYQLPQKSEEEHTPEDSSQIVGPVDEKNAELAQTASAPESPRESTSNSVPKKAPAANDESKTVSKQAQQKVTAQKAPVDVPAVSTTPPVHTPQDANKINTVMEVASVSTEKETASPSPEKSAKIAKKSAASNTASSATPKKSARKAKGSSVTSLLGESAPTGQEASQQLTFEPAADQFIRATQPIGTAKLTASAFKNDLIQFPHARVVLPLFTRFGAMTADQACCFSYMLFPILYWDFPATPAEILPDLVSMNLVACYPDAVASGADVYVATHCCLEAISKKSVVKANEVLEIGHGDIRMPAQQEMRAETLQRFTQRNEGVIRCLYAMRATLRTSDFASCIQLLTGRDAWCEIGVCLDHKVQRAVVVTASDLMPHQGNAFLAYNPDDPAAARNMDFAYVSTTLEFPDDKDSAPLFPIDYRPTTPPPSVPTDGTVCCAVYDTVFAWNGDEWVIPEAYRPYDWNGEFGAVTKEKELAHDAAVMEASSKMEAKSALYPAIPITDNANRTTKGAFEATVRGIPYAKNLLRCFTMFGGMGANSIIVMTILLAGTGSREHVISEIASTVHQMETAGLIVFYRAEQEEDEKSSHVCGLPSDAVWLLTPAASSRMHTEPVTSDLWPGGLGHMDLVGTSEMSYGTYQEIVLLNVVLLSLSSIAFIHGFNADDLMSLFLLNSCPGASPRFMVGVPWENEQYACALTMHVEDLIEHNDTNMLLVVPNFAPQAPSVEPKDLPVFRNHERDKAETFCIDGMNLYRWDGENWILAPDVSRSDQNATSERKWSAKSKPAKTTKKKKTGKKSK